MDRVLETAALGLFILPRIYAVRGECLLIELVFFSMRRRLWMLQLLPLVDQGLNSDRARV